jgi:hypothetical protein
MKSFGWLMLCLLVGGCGSMGDTDAPTRDEIDALKRRIGQVEKRTKTLEKRVLHEGDKPTKKPPEKDRKKGDGAGEDEKTIVKTQVAVEGDATRVLLNVGKRRFVLPAEVPLGEYNIMAAFADQKPIKTGTVAVEKDKPITLNCSADLKTCVVK